MTDEQIEALKQVARAATPQDIDSAQFLNRFEDGSYVECPACGGEGNVELEADFCNYDGTVIGVQFYGIGREHGAAEAYFRGVKPANVLALIERLEHAERTLLSASKAVTPEGWKLVPDEPTEEMMQAVCKLDWVSPTNVDWDDGYRFMIAAAPQLAAGD